MTDFKEYTDEQLISEFKLLFQEIEERKLGFHLWKELKDNEFFQEINSFSATTAVFGEGEKDLEDVNVVDFQVYLLDKFKALFERHGIEPKDLEERI